jgi:hypothetical protein
VRGGLLNCKYFNAQSLRNKLSSFHDLLYGSDFNIICITESWLCKNFSNGLLDPRGLYTIFRRDRISTFPAGGVCILIRKTLQCNEIFIDCSLYNEVEVNEIDSLIFSHLEIVACTISPKFYLFVVIFPQMHRLIYLLLICAACVLFVIIMILL